MATGIVSEGLRSIGLDALSLALLVVSLAAYGLLLAATGWRIVRWPQSVLDDAESPSRAFGYLTFVAATGVLASRFGASEQTAATLVLVVIAGAAWIVLSYGIPLALVLHPHSSATLADANGSWFMWTVATQAIAVGAADLVRLLPGRHPGLALIAVCAWSVGLILYLVLVGLISTRLLAFPLTSEGLTPSYWIFMGATAITVLAGARILATNALDMVPVARPVVGGLSLALWAFGSWLVPLLLGASIWRHVHRGHGADYESGLWAVVFPIGMYGVASLEFGVATGLPWLEGIGRVGIWVSLGAWIGVGAVAARAAVHSTRAAS